MQLSYLGKYTFPNQPNVPTFSYALGPNCLTSNGRMLVHGHNNYNDIAEVQFPAAFGQQVQLIRWFDPTLGNLASYSAANRLNGLGTQGTWHHGIFQADGRTWGCVSPYYNVNNAWMATLWNSDGTTFQGWGKPSINSMKSTGHCGVLPPRLQAAWGHDTWSVEIGVAGLAATENGPGCFTFTRTATITNQATFTITPRFESPFSNPYPGWWGDRECNGICFTDTHMVLGYRKSFGARWYGLPSGSGHYQTEPGAAAHPIPSELHPGQLAQDPCSNAQGNHAEQFAAFLLVASIDSILAGTPVWEEIDLRPMGIVSKWGRVDPKYDPTTGRLYLTEFRADVNDKPLLHVLQTPDWEDPAMIAELQATIAQLTQQVNALAADDDAKTAQIATLTDSVTTVTAQRDAAQAKIATAIAALS